MKKGENDVLFIHTNLDYDWAFVGVIDRGGLLFNTPKRWISQDLPKINVSEMTNTWLAVLVIKKQILSYIVINVVMRKLSWYDKKLESLNVFYNIRNSTCS